MKSRTLSSPILSAIVLSLVATVSHAAQTEPGVPNSMASAPATQPVPPTPVSAAAPGPTAAKRTISYTVVAGDSLTSIANKFNTTRRKLKALNNLASSTVKPGQILEIPAAKSAKPALTADATAKPSKAKSHHTYLVAQPVQDFDIPASTFASCPVPLPSPDEDADTDSGDSSTSTAPEKSEPIAKLVSPAEMAADQERQRIAAAAAMPRIEPLGPAPSGLLHPPAQSNAFAAPFNPPAPKLTSRGLNPLPGSSSPSATAATAASDWGNRFLQQARVLANKGIEYDDDWRPPGESHSWTMDCSNTTRYLYRVTAGIELPRTASDQYYYLHLQGKAWDVPQIANGLPDTNFLRHNLKPGDLLFWENTYRPERQPPITHVMVYLGTNQQGQWLMAGSQSSRGGEHNRSNGGPDVYVFRPSQPCGGYTTWLGMVHHKGRFCAFGRPLEADRSKLAVAEND